MLNIDYQNKGLQEVLKNGVFQLFTFYEEYLINFYLENPWLKNASFLQQMQALYNDGFGIFHVYSPFIAEYGVPSLWVVANCEWSQKAWAKENGFAFAEDNWKEDILRRQLEFYEPSVLYSLNPIDFDSKFIKTLNKRPELIVGWRAAEIPNWVDWSQFDLILSHLTICREKALECGAKKTMYFHPSLPLCIREKAANVELKYDVVFSGQWTSQHQKRNEIITALAQAAEIHGFKLGLFLCSHNFELPEVVKKYDQGACWGSDMYKTLSSSKIIVNAEIDLARGEAGNLRLFEAVAVGSFLITENQNNIKDYLTPGEHIEIYNTPEELIEKILSVLSDEELRKKRAKQANIHLYEKFGMKRGSQEIIQIFVEQLNLKKMLENKMINSNIAEQAINGALSFLKKTQPNEALALMDRVPEVNRLIRDFAHVRGLCLLQLSRFGDAAAAIEKEISTFPDNHAARELLDDIYSQINQQNAGSLLSPISSNQGTSGMATSAVKIEQLANQAISFLQNGDGVAALKISENIKALAPKGLGVNYLRMLCLNAVGRHEEALVAAEEELLVNPTHQGARAEFERLSQALKKQVIPALNPEQRSYGSSLDKQTLHNIQNATHNYTYRGVPMIKNPFDYALYPLLIWDVKPKTIIEIGSKNGGSALWFGDLMNNFGIEGHIYSLDIVKVDDVSHERVTFMEANGRDLGSTISKEWLESLPRPLLVIEDADHSYETSIEVLNFFHSHVRGEEYIVIEDGIISDLTNDQNCNSGPHRALKEFLAKHPGEYDIDQKYADYFGYNYTWCSNGFLRKKKYSVNQQLPKNQIAEFLSSDPVPYGLESQMSVNERFQLYTAIRSYLPKNQKNLRYIEIGSHAGASLKLEDLAAKKDGRKVEAIAVEPHGLPSFYEVVKEIGALHIKAFSHQAIPHLRNIIEQDGVLPEFIMIDGDHSYEGVYRDAMEYYELLAPGGIVVFHDYLPELNETNREAIFFHHAGKEPGIRQACQEVMERHYKAELIDAPLLYPTDPTQTQAHLPVIPGVYSTIRIYRKPF